MNAELNNQDTINSLYQMTGDQRKQLFEKYLDPQMAVKIAGAFERAMVAKQKRSLDAWKNHAFGLTEKKSKGYKTVSDRINELDQLGALNPAMAKDYLSNLVEEKLGISVTPEELKEITTRARNVDKLFTEVDEDGVPKDEFWKALKEMDDYTKSLAPVHWLKVATSTAGRGAMLASIKSPLQNIMSNTVQMALTKFERRLDLQTSRGLNPEFARAYRKKVNHIYQLSGYDISRMSAAWMGEMRLGEQQEIHSQGKGAIRWAGRVYEDIVFKQLMGAPDVWASAIAFADHANLASTYYARKAEKEGRLGGKTVKEYALDLFREATLVKPKYSAEAELVRGQAIADAQYSTYTNSGVYSKVALSLRTALNSIGNFRLGDQLMPFVKTPANVVQSSIDHSALGFIPVALKLPAAWEKMKAGDSSAMRIVIADAVKAGVGTSLAVALAFMIPPDDFVGAYDAIPQKQREIARLKNAPYNSVKIGGHWFSLDFLGVLGAQFVGVMYARKYGNGTLGGVLWEGLKGTAGQATTIPGFRQIRDMYEGMQQAMTRGTAKSVGEGLRDEVVAYVRSRTIPAIINDLAQATDPYQRATGRSEASKVKASIPGWRQTLPVKPEPMTGKPLRSEPAWSVILFGSRLKTARDNQVISEINRLYGEDAVPTIADPEFSSPRMKDLKNQVKAVTFQQAISMYHKEWGRRMGETVHSPIYKEADDEKKKDMLNDDRTDALDVTLSRFHFKKTEKPKVKKVKKPKHSY
jgi:hypothetical protein